MSRHLLVVMTNAAEGREDEFNEWYDERHVPDVLAKLDGVAAVQRFRLSEVGAGQDAPYRYLALYEIEEGSLEDAYASILWSRAEREEALAAGREPQVPISPTLEEERSAWFYSPIGARVEAAAEGV